MRQRQAWTLGAALLLLSAPLWAQREVQRPFWYTLEQGKLAFRTGAYGEALASFERARDQRRAMFTRMEEDFIALLSMAEVRRLGDSLEQVESYIASRSYLNVSGILEEVYYRVPRASLEGSASRALTEMGRLKDYPEAEYWIGETYRAEGEMGIALRQYEKAYELRSLLENPGFAPELLYKMADIHRVRAEYNQMEARLLEILAGDSLWSEDPESFLRNAMNRVLENDGINRFLTVYRYNNAAVLRAHSLLGFYYYTRGRHSRAVEHLLFAFLIQNTLLIEELSRIQYGFTFTSIDALIAEVVRRPALAAYLEELEYYRIAYYLGSSYYGDGKAKIARMMWDMLNRQRGAGEWQARAATQLKSPFVERGGSGE